MNQVWLFLKIIQIVMEITCLSFHMVGASYLPEPLPHNLIFCSTYAGFLLITIVRAIHLLIGCRTVLYLELYFNAAGMLMHFICAWTSMYYVEIDFHLTYMGKLQELSHKFFGNCKGQAVFNIVAAAVYLLHGVLILDFIVKSFPNADAKPIKIVTKPPEWEDTIYGMTVEKRDFFAKTAADVWLLNRRLDYFLCVRFKWFCQLAYGQQLQQKLQFDEQLSELNHSSYTISVISLAKITDPKISLPKLNYMTVDTVLLSSSDSSIESGNDEADGSDEGDEVDAPTERNESSHGDGRTSQ